VSTSAAVFVGLVGSMMGYPILDPLAGLLVAGLIVRQVRTLSVLLSPPAARDGFSKDGSERMNCAVRLRNYYARIGLLLIPSAGGIVLLHLLSLSQGGLTVVDSLRDLSDAPASAQETEKLKQTCLGVSGVMSVEVIKARKSGPYLYVEATIDVDGSISASAAHR
jgi:divalent metal cation (Fe/Co/Zn/Cd) transporter